MRAVRSGKSNYSRGCGSPSLGNRRDSEAFRFPTCGFPKKSL